MCKSLTARNVTSSALEFEETEMEDMINIFKILSNSSRVRIISALSNQESLSVGSIAELLDLEISLVSHHLSTLKMLGFVKPKKAGKKVFYSIEDDCIIDILQRAKDHVAGN